MTVHYIEYSCMLCKQGYLIFIYIKKSPLWMTLQQHSIFFYIAIGLDILYLMDAKFCSLDIPLNLLSYYLFRTSFCETRTVNH
jgi:hypothetical protein